MRNLVLLTLVAFQIGCGRLETTESQSQPAITPAAAQSESSNGGSSDFTKEARFPIEKILLQEGRWISANSELNVGPQGAHLDLGCSMASIDGQLFFNSNEKFIFVRDGWVQSLPGIVSERGLPPARKASFQGILDGDLLKLSMKEYDEKEYQPVGEFKFDKNGDAAVKMFRCL